MPMSEAFACCSRPYFLRPGLSLNLELTTLAAQQTSHIPLHLPPRVRIRYILPCTHFYRCWGSNHKLPCCTTSHLLNGPPPRLASTSHREPSVYYSFYCFLSFFLSVEVWLFFVYLFEKTQIHTVKKPDVVHLPHIYFTSQCVGDWDDNFKRWWNCYKGRIWSQMHGSSSLWVFNSLPEWLSFLGFTASSQRVPYFFGQAASGLYLSPLSLLLYIHALRCFYLDIIPHSLPPVPTVELSYLPWSSTLSLWQDARDRSIRRGQVYFGWLQFGGFQTVIACRSLGLVSDRPHDREKMEEGRSSPHGREPRGRGMRVLIPTSRPCPEGPTFLPVGPISWNGVGDQAFSAWPLGNK